MKNYVAFSYFKWYLALAHHKEGNITEAKFLSGIRKDIDRLKNTYQIDPSERVIGLLEFSIKRPIY